MDLHKNSVATNCQGDGWPLTVREVEIAIPGQRKSYDELFEVCPSAFIQQSSYWAEIIQAVAGDIPRFLVCLRDDHPIAGLPLYLHGNPRGNILTSVPLPGPMGGVFYRDELGEEDVENAYTALIGHAVRMAEESDCLTLTLITNPFRPDIHRYERHLAPQYVLENFTQYIPPRGRGRRWPDSHSSRATPQQPQPQPAPR